MRSLSLLIASGIPSALALCPPPGPLLPPPAVKTSGFSIPDSKFESLPWLSDTTFAIKAKIGSTDVFRYSHAAPGYHTSDVPLYGTKMRIGSVTKLYTVLAIKIAREQIGWEDPIGKFIPELANNPAYKDVTISNLAGQTSGLGRFVSLDMLTQSIITR
jgi:hypothetical protein